MSEQIKECSPRKAMASDEQFIDPFTNFEQERRDCAWRQDHLLLWVRG